MEDSFFGVSCYSCGSLERDGLVCDGPTCIEKGGRTLKDDAVVVVRAEKDPRQIYLPWRPHTPSTWD